MNLRVVFLLLLRVCVCVQVGWIAGAGANSEENRGSESAEDLVQLLRSRGIGKIRLRDADSVMLRALGTLGGGGDGEREVEELRPIEVIVGLRNDEIPNAGASMPWARSWVAQNVVPYVPATNIVGVSVGNEVLTGEAPEDSSCREFLVAAMQNVHSAIAEAGLARRIKVSAPQSVRALSDYFASPSTPFHHRQPRGREAIAPLLEFLAISGSYFMLNLHPDDLGRHDAGLAKSSSLPDLSSSVGIGLRYSNVLDSVVDALSVAMESVDQHHRRNLDIVVTANGWSSSAKSAVFNAGLVDRILGRRVSPSHTRVAIDAFVDAKDLEALPRRMSGSSSSSSGRAGAFSSRRLLGSPPVLARPGKSPARRKLAANKSWCVAKSGGSTQALQTALDWACGTGGADCSAIQVGRNCFLPNNINSHASYAFNSYYQMKSWASGSCDFNGLATTTSSDPSNGSCLYTSSTDANGNPSTPTGTTVPSAGVRPRLVWNRRGLILTASILGFLLRRILSDWKF